MSDPNLSVQSQIQVLKDGHERLRKADVPAIYLPWSQRTLNPFPLASSGGVWGDTPQPWANSPLAFNASVLVNTTNSATQFWTLSLFTVATSGATTLITSALNTSAIAANTPARLSVALSGAPPSTDVWYQLIVTATLVPGSIFIFPSLALLRMGN